MCAAYGSGCADRLSACAECLRAIFPACTARRLSASDVECLTTLGIEMSDADSGGKRHKGLLSTLEPLETGQWVLRG
jgi:hypothetical protein